MSETKTLRRRQRLIRPRFQLKMVATFLGVSIFALVLQALLIGALLSHASVDLGSAGIALIGRAPRLQAEALLYSLALVLPLTLAIGVVVTFRVAGPVHRLEQFLKDVRDGNQVEPCKLRDGDELQQLCTIVNETTAPLREANATRDCEEDLAEPVDAAA